MTALCQIRSYQEGDEKHILELFSLSFGGRQMSLPYWKWRFQDNPAGHGVIELCWDGNVLVAHYAVTNLTMSIHGQILNVGLSGTTMTHPAYRGMSLFQMLARSTYHRMLKINMPLVWGFPNLMSHRSFVCELDWVDIYEVPMFRLHLEPRLKDINTSNEYIFELSSADERFDTLWERIRNDYDIITQRDRAYINWRYFMNPSEKYKLIGHVENNEIQGYAVFKHYGDELQVVDLMMGKEAVDVGENLITYLIAQALKENASSVSLWMNVTHPLHHALEKIGFRPEGPVTYLGGLVLNTTIDKSFYDFKRWYFTMSDSDVF